MITKKEALSRFMYLSGNYPFLEGLQDQARAAKKGERMSQNGVYELKTVGILHDLVIQFDVRIYRLTGEITVTATKLAPGKRVVLTEETTPIRVAWEVFDAKVNLLREEFNVTELLNEIWKDNAKIIPYDQVEYTGREQKHSLYKAIGVAESLKNECVIYQIGKNFIADTGDMEYLCIGRHLVKIPLTNIDIAEQEVKK